MLLLMKFHILPIFSFLFFTLALSDAALPSELYWNKVLPYSTMPNLIKDLLSSGKEGAYIKVLASLGHKNLSYSMGPTFSYFAYGASLGDQFQANLNTSLFFFDKNIREGKNINFHFAKTHNVATFLPREIAKLIPFSSKKFPEISDLLSVKHGSKEAKMMKNSIKLCEHPAIVGEPHTCAKSLESMIDFAVSQLGRNIRAITTEVEKETQNQAYTIGEVVKVMSPKLVACHRLAYLYAVFYCHSPLKTEAHSVRLVGADGKMVNAVAVCHKDTSAWYPKHLAFQLLKVTPGTVPICHFVLQDHIIWATI